MQTANHPEPSLLMSMREAAAALAVCERTLWTLVKEAPAAASAGWPAAAFQSGSAGTLDCRPANLAAKQFRAIMAERAIRFHRSSEVLPWPASRPIPTAVDGSCS